MNKLPMTTHCWAGLNPEFGFPEHLLWEVLSLSLVADIYPQCSRCQGRDSHGASAGIRLGGQVGRRGQLVSGEE